MLIRCNPKTLYFKIENNNTRRRIYYGFDSRREYQKGAAAILRLRLFGILPRESSYGSSIRRQPYSCRRTPACGKRQIPVLPKIIRHLFFAESSRLRETANSARSKQNFGSAFLVFTLANRAMVRQYGVSRILAVGLPLAGNGKFPSDETTCSHFFEILFNAKTTFSCVSGIK